MNNILFWLGILFVLVIAMLGCIELGRYYFYLQIKKNPKKEPPDLHVIEAALFGLMGLLVAFTFASANVKLDARRLLIIDEVNAISTAYLRLDLLAKEPRMALQSLYKQYVDSRLDVYSAMMDYKTEQKNIASSQRVQQAIWDKAVEGCSAVPSSAGCMLLLPAINSMFDIANTRLSYTKLHPPVIVFVLLVAVALISAFISGYSMSVSKRRSILHIFFYAAIMVLALYVIIDLEFPRYGFIRENAFDKQLTNLRNSM